MAAEPALLLLANFYWHVRSHEKARSVLERIVRATPEDGAAKTLLGWVMLSQQADEMGLGDVSEVDEALEFFESVLHRTPTDLEVRKGPLFK